MAWTLQCNHFHFQVVVGATGWEEEVINLKINKEHSWIDFSRTTDGFFNEKSRIEMSEVNKNNIIT